MNPGPQLFRCVQKSNCGIPKEGYFHQKKTRRTKRWLIDGEPPVYGYKKLTAIDSGFTTGT